MRQQLRLPLNANDAMVSNLRRVWLRNRLSIPFPVAGRDRALSICLRCLAEASHGGRQHG